MHKIVPIKIMAAVLVQLLHTYTIGTTFLYYIQSQCFT